MSVWWRWDRQNTGGKDKIREETSSHWSGGFTAGLGALGEPNGLNSFGVEEWFRTPKVIFGSVDQHINHRRFIAVSVSNVHPKGILKGLAVNL